MSEVTGYPAGREILTHLEEQGTVALLRESEWLATNGHSDNRYAREIEEELRARREADPRGMKEALAMHNMSKPDADPVAEAIESIGGPLSEQNVRGLISAECDALKALLLDKNRKYGNSALDPLRTFSKASPIEQINVRIDDKLSRLRSGQADEDEDVVQDLLGYLVLLRIAKRLRLG